MDNTTPNEVEVLDIAIIEPQLNQSDKRRRNKTLVSDDSTCSTALSSSDDSSNDSQSRRRRNPRRPKKNNRQRRHKCQPQEVQLSLEEQAQYIALDCEMVGIGYRGRSSSVARVTLVGWNGDIIYDEMVRQAQEVTDYRTFVSGITAEDLEQATTTLEECRQQVTDILEGKVLVGHALKNDLRALSIAHPWYQTRDTAKYEPFMQVRFDDGILWPRKLKELAKNRLQRDIQIPGQPHSVYEDALAALDLYKNARSKWEKAMEYKIEKTREMERKNIQNEQAPQC